MRPHGVFAKGSEGGGGEKQMNLKSMDDVWWSFKLHSNFTFCMQTSAAIVKSQK